MKRIPSMILAILIISTMLVLPASAEGKKSGLFTYELMGNGTAVITGFDWVKNGNADIYIPRMLDGYTVTGIGEMAFDASSAYGKLEDKGVVVIIPDTVVSIGAFAFADSPIISPAIPASVQYIGAGAFADCQYIETFTVAAENSVYATIDGVLFNKIEKTLHTMPTNYEILNEYIIPEGILRIEDYAFFSLAEPYGYRSIDCRLPSTLVSIGAYAFADNSISGLFETFPPFLKELGEGAFWNTSFGLTDTSLFEGTQINTIPDLCFAGAKISLHNYDTQRHNPLSEGIMHIGNYAFADTELTVYGNKPFDFTIPASVETVGDYAFASTAFNNRGEYTLVFPDNSKLKSIGECAFACVEFDQESIEIPSMVQSVGSNAFNCTIDIPSYFSPTNELVYLFFQYGCYVNQCKLNKLIIPASVSSIGNNICDRSQVVLQVEAGSYSSVYASQNGYRTTGASADDTSWLNE